MTSPAIRSALADIATAGGFFDVEVTEPTNAPSGSTDGEWLALAQLYNDSAVLAQRISAIRDRLATRANRDVADIEPRVAASIMYQGLASRLLSPAIGTAVAHGLVYEAETLRWQPPQDGPVPLWLAEDRAVATGQAPAETISTCLLEAVFEPLIAAVRTQVKLAPGLLWGNLASSVSGASQRLGQLRPELAPAAHRLAENLLNTEFLAGRGEFVRPFTERPQATFFVRRTCCLYYRIPNNGKCGDCALLSPQNRRAQWQRAAGIR